VEKKLKTSAIFWANHLIIAGQCDVGGGVWWRGDENKYREVGKEIFRLDKCIYYYHLCKKNI